MSDDTKREARILQRSAFMSEPDKGDFRWLLSRLEAERGRGRGEKAEGELLEACGLLHGALGFFGDNKHERGKVRKFLHRSGFYKRKPIPVPEPRPATCGSSGWLSCREGGGE